MRPTRGCPPALLDVAGAAAKGEEVVASGMTVILPCQLVFNSGRTAGGMKKGCCCGSRVSDCQVKYDGASRRALACRGGQAA